jgi:APA family basic amino acid/polyamine antiporter
MAFTTIGMDWNKSIVAFGALKGMTTVLLVNVMGRSSTSRTSHGSTWHRLASLWYPKVGAPVRVKVAMLTTTACIAFFTDLGILFKPLSISTLFIFILAAVA